jgi:pimeloyl-ACP methyl ester carboxylesterase
MALFYLVIPALLALPPVESGTAQAPDGLPIAYDVRGLGQTALVFIHCFACDRSYWHNQLDVFAARYRVVSLDLGGHGASTKERQHWSVADLGGDVQAVVERLRLRRVILVGHSMGGPVALEAARRLPKQVIGIVAIDTLHDVDLVPSKEMVEELASRFETDFAGTMKGFVRSAFLADADQTVVDWVSSRAVVVDPKATLAILRDFSNLDLKAMFRAVKVPIRCINSAPHPPSGSRTAVEKNRKYADFDAVILDGVGHFPMLERPQEFNSLLREQIQAVDHR